ncbi:hypothetical protein MNBD_DELTA01-736 [hydrothermal vent metagenome]|uniref:DUF4234 domain-containing protein n=1 Tax=hydrothermal vent metagenome TaxID=652676 RepID=A0A3B0QX12_9ZZZZ
MVRGSLHCEKCGSFNNSWARACTSCGEETGLKMQAVTLEKMGVAKLVILTVITGGVYTAFWFLKRLDIFNSFRSERKLRQGIFGFIIAGCIVNIAIVFYLAFAGVGLDEAFALRLLNTSNILGFAVNIVVLLQTFKLRRILLDHYAKHLGREVKLSWILTFFFHIFYLQFKINRL